MGAIMLLTVLLSLFLVVSSAIGIRALRRMGRSAADVSGTVRFALVSAALLVASVFRFADFLLVVTFTVSVPQAWTFLGIHILCQLLSSGALLYLFAGVAFSARRSKEVAVSTEMDAHLLGKDSSSGRSETPAAYLL
jgi:hypothetical protein